MTWGDFMLFLWDVMASLNRILKILLCFVNVGTVILWKVAALLNVFSFTTYNVAIGQGKVKEF